MNQAKGRKIKALLLGTLMLAGGVLGAAEDPLKAVEARWGVLEQYCFDCHNFEDWAGSLALDTLEPEGIAEHAEVWEKVVRKLRGRLMPPPGNPRPQSAELDALVAALEDSLDQSLFEHGPHAGRVAIHRLNRTEYENEIRRVLALEIDAGSLLPPDTRSDGFDNVANVLQVSPTFLDQYLGAARDISIQAVGEKAPKAAQTTYEAPDPIGQHSHVSGLPLGTRGGFLSEHYFPVDGEYRLSLRLSSPDGSLLRSYPMGWLEYEHTLILTLDGEEVFREKLGGFEDLKAVDQRQQQAVDEIHRRFRDILVPVSAGPHRVGAAFIAKTFAESDRKLEHTLPGQPMDSIPLVMGMSVTGPFNIGGLGRTPSRDKIFTCYPENSDQEIACAERIIGALGRAAFRRSLQESDMNTLLPFYRDGSRQGGFEKGIQKAVMAILASPKFLYRAEELPEDAKAGEAYPLTDFELASRLSFFLWSEGPDEALLQAAESGGLREGSSLNRQIRRMLADPRSRTLVENFAMQWLKAGDIEAIDPDPRIFPEFDATLRESFKEELLLFVDSILREDRPVTDLLNARHSYVNERLARHYGIKEVRGDRFRRVELGDSSRWGLLGKAGVLMLTSYPNRTSPVLRGAYIMEAIIGVPPAAPPPDVETDLEDEPGARPTTVRARLEQHRANPSCNNCHGVIDPLGLALENFDAIGGWRDKDRWADRPIDAAGQLAGGGPITGPEDLRNALLERPQQFVQTFTGKLMTYGLGRALEYEDMPVVRQIVAASEAEEYRFSAIIQAIVESAPFQMKSLPLESEAGGQSLTRK